MKKIFTLLAGAAVALSASAQNLPCTVNPPSGSTLTSLEKIEITSTLAAYPEVSFYGKPQMKKDDSTYINMMNCTMTDGDPGVITFATPITEPGSYVFTLPSYNFDFNDGGDDYVDPFTDLVCTYTIVAGTQEEPAIKWTPSPEPGVVESLSSVVFTYSTSDYAEVEVVTSDDISVTKDGQPFSQVKCTDAGGTFTVNLKTTATAPGTYKLTFLPGSITTWSPAYDESPVEETLSYEWVIEGSAQEEFAFTTTPANGATLQAPLSSVSFAFEGCASAKLEETKLSGVKVTKDGQPVAATFTVTNEGLASTLNISPALEDAGAYVLSLENGVITYMATGATEAATIAPQEISFTLTPAPQPVVYDLTVTSTKPANGATVDLQDTQLESLFINVASGVKAGPNAKVTVTSDNGYSCEAQLKFSFDTRLLAFITEVTEAGTYTVTIPQGSFGDAEWIANPEQGHSNAEYTFSFSCTKGPQFTADLQWVGYAPSSQCYVEDLAKISLSYSASVQANTQARVELTDASGNYLQRSGLVPTAVNGTFDMLFTPAPTEAGTYTLKVPLGAVGDAAFIESDGQQGRTNPAFELTFTADVNGLSIVGADAEGAVYFDMEGRQIAKPAPGQPVIKIQAGKTLKTLGK